MIYKSSEKLREFEIPILNHTRYFGVYLACHGIPDSIVVLHKGTGCKMKGGLHLPDMMRESFSQVCWTEVSGVDIVSDSHSMIEDTILTNYERRSPGCIAVATSSVIDMTGFDMRAAVDEIRKKVNCPLIYIPTPGYEGDMYDGYAEFTREFLKHVDWSVKPEEGVVNVMGNVFERYEMEQTANVNEMRRLLAGIGLKAQAVFFSGQRTESLLNAGKGTMNIALPYYGKMTETLEKDTGRKSVSTDLPVGISGTTNWLRKVSEAYGIESSKVEQVITAETRKINPLVEMAKRHISDIKVTIIQPAPFAAACAALTLELGMKIDKVALMGESHGGKEEFFESLFRFCGVDRSREIDVYEYANWYDIERILEVSEKDYMISTLLISPSIEKSEKNVRKYSNVETGYPSHSKHFTYALPYYGYNGVVVMAQRILDAGLRIS